MNTKVNIPLSNCRVCESSAVEFKAYAVVAPWIEGLVDSNEIMPTALLHCPSCDFDFFSHGYTDSQMDSLYSGYRGEKYFGLRRKYEPWFTRKSLDYWNPIKNPTAVKHRRDFMAHTFKSFEVEIRSEFDVLDFGGDLGQFFPSGMSGRKYLLDPSAGEPIEGITKVTSLENFSQVVDLVMNCHTLEHLPSLRGEISSIARIINKGRYLYVEVPLDRFMTSRFCRSSIYRSYLLFLRRNIPIFIFVDFLTGLYRLHSRKIPFWGIVKQSEHLNYFSKSSLVKLLDDSFLVIGATEPDLSFGQGRIRVGRIAVVGQRR